MNRKKLLISASIIIVLTGYIIVKNMKKSTNLPELSAWNNEINFIEIKKNNSIIKIVKKEKKWLINDALYPADMRIIEDIKSKIKNLRIVDLVSKKGFYNKYDLTSEKGISVIVKKDGKSVRELLIGKKSPTNKHTFIKINNKPEIYLVSGIFDGNFSKTADELREKLIFSVKNESISGFEIKYKNRSFQFNKTFVEKKQDKENKSKLKEKTKIDINKKPEKIEKWTAKGYDYTKIPTSKINSLLSGLNALTAVSFSTIEKNILTNPTCSIKIKSENKEIELNIFQMDKDKDKRFIATSSESPYVFTLDEWRVKKFFLENIEGLKEK